MTGDMIRRKQKAHNVLIVYSTTIKDIERHEQMNRIAEIEDR